MMKAKQSKYEELYTKEIIIWCAGQYGKEILIQAERLSWHICCFCDIQKEKQGKNVNNIPVYSFNETQKRYPHAVIVIAHSDYSECLRIGRKLEKQKYIKNQTYFIAIELETKGILPIIKVPFCMKDRKIILLGPQYLCEKFMEWAENEREQIEICLSEKEIETWKCKFPDALWIPLYRDPLGIEHEKKIIWYHECLLKENIMFTEWFLRHFDYCDGLNFTEIESNIANTSVKKVLFSILPCNTGNSFLDGVLDSHPDILYFGLEMYVWTNNIWDIIQVAKQEKGAGITEKIVEKIKEYIADAWNKNIDTMTVIPLPDRNVIWLDKYRKYLDIRMNEDRQYTEKEILINMYLAWKEAHHMTVTGEESVIYMDIHGSCVLWETYNMMVRWLKKLGFEVILINMVRRPYAQSASAMKQQISFGNFQKETALWTLLFSAYEELYGELRKCKILRLRFEDVKQYPEIVLGKLCRELQISWNKSMLETTSAGKTSKCIVGNEGITGYNMKPVWYPYDEFFDAFDKFRIDILCKEKCKAYDYPYVSEEKYPMPIDDLIELFELPFQFEKYVVFTNEEERKLFRQIIKEKCRQIIQWQEKKEHMQNFFCFGPYLNAIK